MEDIRQVERNHIQLMVNFLTDTYPKFFEQTSYEHPIHGTRNSLILKFSKNKSIDIDIIKQIEIDFFDNNIKIRTRPPLSNTYVAINFIIDETVM